MRNVLDKIVQKKHILCSVIFFFSWKLYCLWDNMETYGEARQATDDSFIWHKHIACLTVKDTDMFKKCNT